MYTQTSDFHFLLKKKLESHFIKLKWIGKPPNILYVKTLIYFFPYENTMQLLFCIKYTTTFKYNVCFQYIFEIN